VSRILHQTMVAHVHRSGTRSLTNNNLSSTLACVPDISRQSKMSCVSYFLDVEQSQTEGLRRPLPDGGEQNSSRRHPLSFHSTPSHCRRWYSAQPEEVTAQGHLFLFLRALHLVGMGFGRGVSVRSGGSGGGSGQRPARPHVRWVPGGGEE
jgi:hypothetical protein